MIRKIASKYQLITIKHLSINNRTLTDKMSITNISAKIFSKNDSRNDRNEQTIKQNAKKPFKTKNLKDYKD